MCAVSMIGDFYGEKFKPYVSHPVPFGPVPTITLPPEITRNEFEALRKEVLDMKELLKRAKEYDERTGQPECEMESKMELLRAVAKAVGVDLDSVLKKGP